jgi:hypothetical protein
VSTTYSILGLYVHAYAFLLIRFLIKICSFDNLIPNRMAQRQRSAHYSECFLPNPFPFFTHQSSYHSTMYSLGTDRAEKVNHKICTVPHKRVKKAQWNTPLRCEKEAWKLETRYAPARTHLGGFPSRPATSSFHTSSLFRWPRTRAPHNRRFALHSNASVNQDMETQTVERRIMGRTAGIRFLTCVIFLSSPQRSDGFWNPRSLVTNGYRGRFSMEESDRGVKLTTRHVQEMVELCFHP